MTYDQKYKIIYADPPWDFKTYSEKGQVKTPHRHYDCMSEKDIGALPVKDLADKDCALFLWTIDSHLKHSLDIIEQWGFTYKTVAFVWAKTTKHGKWHFGQGYWTRKNPELCLFATRGTPKKASWAVRQLVVSPVREHSRKPDEIRDSIVQLMGDVKRIELFARVQTPGWDVYGNEVGKFNE